MPLTHAQHEDGGLVYDTGVALFSHVTDFLLSDSHMSLSLASLHLHKAYIVGHIPQLLPFIQALMLTIMIVYICLAQGVTLFGGMALME